MITLFGKRSTFARKNGGQYRQVVRQAHGLACASASFLAEFTPKTRKQRHRICGIGAKRKYHEKSSTVLTVER